MKKIFLFLIAGLLVLGISGISFAQDAVNQTEAAKAVNVGNKICPVSGEKIDEKLKSTYEYKGKIYNFCCTACIADFKKDPEKYIKKVDAELKEGAKQETPEEKSAMPESEMPMGMHEEGHHH